MKILLLKVASKIASALWIVSGIIFLIKGAIFEFTHWKYNIFYSMFKFHNESLRCLLYLALSAVFYFIYISLRSMLIQERKKAYRNEVKDKLQ